MAPTGTNIKPKHKRVNLDATDVVRGNPAQIVIGNEEQPAKKHRRLEPKPKVVKIETIIFDIEQRVDELQAAHNEYLRLERALKKLRNIK